MYTEELIKRINKILVNWSSELEINGKLNLLNGHVLSEDLFARVLNLVYGYDLTNRNENEPNADGADLADHKNKILIQVTSTATSEKIKNSVRPLDIENYQGYTFYMLYINKISYEPRIVIENLQYIAFDVKKNIIDLTTIMRKIMHLNVPKMENLHDLLLIEIGGYLPDFGNQEMSSDLVAVLKSLSKNNFKEYYRKDIPLSFKIREKIRQNDLEINQELIENNNAFFGLMQTIYDTYDSEADNTSYAVWEKITDFGREISMNEHLKGDPLFTKIWKEAYNYVKNDQKLHHLSKERVENCIKIIVVDAFLRCKIMKRPIDKEGEHDVVAE